MSTKTNGTEKPRRPDFRAAKKIVEQKYRPTATYK